MTKASSLCVTANSFIFLRTIIGNAFFFFNCSIMVTVSSELFLQDKANLSILVQSGVTPGSCSKSVIFPHLVGFHSSRQNTYLTIQLDYSPIYVFYTHLPPQKKEIYIISMLYVCLFYL